MLTISLWAFACIGVVWVLFSLVKLSKRLTPQSGCLEMYVTNGETFVEGVIRSLAPCIKSNRAVSMVIYCVDCTDQTADIVSRLHLLDPWFTFQVYPAIPLENTVHQMAHAPSEDSEVCRIRLTSGQNPKEAIRFVQNWLQKM
ncbi:MAG: hypothetical protein JWN30_731 [Bacilli bacterium]|nr:hypothetical protein [Bacilli bacterium]